MKGELILSLPDKSGYINALISILRDKYGTVGLLAELYVKRIWRGQGYGKVLMSNFESQTLDVTKVDILVALTAEPQLKGFNLQRYYESRGFQAVYLNGDSVLMANKGQAETIINNLC
ncbi:MAG: GNAT superfamily N-acetyltransferase [Psychromonas sp.]|jgi:GNAT superfamily N-acetyltransferase